MHHSDTLLQSFLSSVLPITAVCTQTLDACNSHGRCCDNQMCLAGAPRGTQFVCLCDSGWSGARCEQAGRCT